MKHGVMSASDQRLSHCRGDQNQGHGIVGGVDGEAVANGNVGERLDVEDTKGVVPLGLDPLFDSGRDGVGM